MSSKRVCITATARLKQDYLRMMRDPVPYVKALPRPSNILEWRYIVFGPENTPYEGGIYHGKLVFPSEFPFKPPGIYMITPNGRFKTNKRLCLSISDFHPDTWNPAWSASTILTGLLSFMVETSRTVGSIETSEYEKRRLAAHSGTFNLQDKVFTELFQEIAEEIRGKIEKQREQEAIDQQQQKGLTSNILTIKTTMTEAQQHVAQNVIQAAALSGNAKSEPHRFTEGARARDVHRVEHIRDEDDELLQFAIQQSLLENGSENDQVTVWEALTNRRPSDTSPNQPNRTVTPSAYISYEERQLQRAIEGRLHDTAAAAAAAPAAMSVRSSDSDLVNISNGNMSENSEPECSDDQLRIAMAMSQREADGAAARRKQEQAELERIIQLSFTEK